MKYVILVGAGKEQAYVCQKIQNLGYGVLMTDINPSAPGSFVADDFRVASTYDTDASVKASREMAQGRNVVAVMAIGVDVPLTAATVAKELGCLHMPLDACRMAMSKLDMQNFMTKNNIPSARFLSYRGEIKNISFEECADRLGKKLIIKPTDSRGARGVYIVEDTTFFQTAYENALKYSPSGTVMVEEFLDGPQISGESLIVDGKAYTVGFFDRNYSRMKEYWPLIIEDGADGPSDYVHLRPETDSLVEDLAAKLEIGNGIIKTDLVVHEGNIKIIEFALRMSGGYFGTCAVHASTGVDFIASALHVFQGIHPKEESLIPQEEKGASIRFWFTQSGDLKNISGSTEIGLLPGVVHHDFFFKPGQNLPKVQSMVERRGVVITEGGNKEEAVARAESVINGVEWTIQ